MRGVGELESKFRVSVLRFASFILLAHLLSGCSWITNFVITNKTTSVLKVTYQFSRMRTETGSCFDENWRRVPRVIPISGLRERGAKWRKLNPTEYSCDVKELTVKFQLEPNMAVSVGGEVNYLDLREGLADTRHLGIESLALRGESGSITYEGVQVIRGFRRVDQDLYILEYE